MPANETRAVQIIETKTRLTTREERAFEQAERKIARGLKSFLEVGLALKEIRDKRLYRQEYDTFEEYCIRRWELSRPRAYQLCAASEVMADLSTIVDKSLLPETEWQIRPLTRLKETEQRKQAWNMAVKMAKAGGRPVTALDSEAAVQRLNGNGHIEPAWTDVARSVYESQDDILSAIQRLHCPAGYQLDPTYGNGGFWEKHPRPKLCFDLIPTAPFVAKGDFRNLPLENGSVKSMVLDPPFLTYVKPSKMGIMNGRGDSVLSGTSCQFSVNATIADFQRRSRASGLAEVERGQ